MEAHKHTVKTEIYIGLDVHKETITAAVAEAGRNGEVRQAGTIANDLHGLEKVLRRIRGDQQRTLQVCYEAGPCGFVIGRRLKQLGIECTVVAPSLIPRQAGDKIKTDRRDAEKLARLLRAGDLTGVYVPDATDEAIRDLCRARTDVVDDRRRARYRLKALSGEKCYPCLEPVPFEIGNRGQFFWVSAGCRCSVWGAVVGLAGPRLDWSRVDVSLSGGSYFLLGYELATLQRLTLVSVS